MQHNKNKLMFLGLMKKYKSNNTTILNTTDNSAKILQLTNAQFIRLYIPLLSILYTHEYIYTNKLLNNININILTLKSLYYYANFNKHNQYFTKSYTWNFFYSLGVNNSLVFSKPKKQAYLIFFKTRPVFIFTCGLMRIVMNEKRKSSKKLYKVAISLIKLASILLLKKNYFPSCYLIIKNLEGLKNKILNTFIKAKTHKIHYILIKSTLNTSSQKFSTCRSIKKYVKKRFKICR